MTSTGGERLGQFSPRRGDNPLCAVLGVASELSSVQHFVDPSATMHCFSNTDIFLRFLVEDLGQHLDLVLDTILATLVHRTKDKRRSETGLRQD